MHVLPCSAFSPDLSPIEQLWYQLGRHVFHGRQPSKNCQQLIQTLTREWEAISQYKIRRLLRSMRRICQATLCVNGGHTEFVTLHFRVRDKNVLKLISPNINLCDVFTAE